MSPPSPNGDGVLDLEAAAAAAAAEIEAVPFVFAYKGHKYTLPPMKSWPARALVPLTDGDLTSCLSILLSDAEADALLDAGLTLGELELLFDRASLAAGMGGLGNSPPQRQRSSARR